MANITIIKERIATETEVFNNLRYGGLKLLCENDLGMTISEVDWFSAGKIEVINVANTKFPKIVGSYITDFLYKTLDYVFFSSRQKVYRGKFNGRICPVSSVISHADCSTCATDHKLTSQ